MTCFPLLFINRKEDSKLQPGKIHEEIPVLTSLKVYKYKEVKSATDNFCSSNKIGEGGFGSVYKGKLKDGRTAAIKVLSAGSQQGVEEFLAEINSISRTRHENLVKLYGCCIEGKHRMLVYNYMENNSLARTLLGRGGSHGQFNWKTRSTLCVGVARGLAFLHHEVKPPIVHRDIKASNILLDKNLSPRISDFGLAKLFPDNASHVSTRVAGTFGYLAPEYAIRGRLTRKADIYSFGVLLMEIVSGRCNTNSRLPIGERHILDLAWNLYEKNELAKLVDDDLENFDTEEACRYLKIGLLCTQDMPKLRPSMPTVVKMLTGQMRISNIKISKPGIISDFTEIKVNDAKKKEKVSKNNDGNNISSGSDYNMGDSTMSSNYDQGTNFSSTVCDGSSTKTKSV